MQINNVHLRRIKWALDTPSFLQLEHNAEYYYHPLQKEEVDRILYELDQDPDVVNHYFDSLGYMPLGRYFEQLLFFILERDPFYKVRWANQQIVNKDGITEGEIDLIIEKENGALEHWEIALKYYLQVKASSNHEFFWGPSRKDFLAKKMVKLDQHQLLLGRHKQVVDQFGNIPSKLFLKGELYYPQKKPIIYPDSHNAESKEYFYLKHEELSGLKKQADYFKILFKPDWLSPYQTMDPALLRSFHQVKLELQEQFSNLYRPQLLALMKERSDMYIEMQRIFILPENWPAEPNL